MRISLKCAVAVAVLLVTCSAWANDYVEQANLEFRTMLGPAGRPASSSDEFTFSNGAYVCRNAATRSTPHIVRFPFALPDNRRLDFVHVTGERQGSAPPLTLSVRKACESTIQTGPVTSILKTATPAPNAAGFYTTYLGISEPVSSVSCKYWVQAEFNISSTACTAAKVSVHKIRVESTMPDRIFRGSFHTNVPFNTP